MEAMALLRTKRSTCACLAVVLVAIAVLALANSLSLPVAMAAPAPSCLDCHKNPNLSMELPGGEKLSLYVDESAMAGSVHGGKLGCYDCHSRTAEFPHKKVQVSSRREYSMAQYEACKRCHFANYSKTLDSVHYQVMETGNQNAPLCTDCHGYHNVSRPDEPRSKISLSCSRCHSSTYETYASSVHGAALMKDENKDVPVCTDCHGTHAIQDAGSARFRLESPEMCARCHADEALMRKYNLSSNVFKSYVQDFHGATVALTKRQGVDKWTDKAVCSDCHGVHNIQSTKGSSPADIKKNMVETCKKCHPDASANFPDAWLSHYELSPEKAPLPWLVRSWYVIMIPFMVGGLMLHIVVDLWRIARNRVKEGAAMKTENGKPAEKPREFVRFSVSQRAEHLLMIISFTALVLTGVPQRFFGDGWAQTLIVAMGGIETTRLIHRSFALVFCLEALYHSGYLATIVARGRFTTSMIPGLKDVADALACFRYCVGLTDVSPRFDRFDFRQKFEYWGVVMGGAIMIGTGLVLIFPAQAALVLPGSFVPAAKEMHGGEALLAFSIIVTWHLYGAHFNPLRFPGDLTIFNGKISRERMMEEHPLEYARITGIPREEGQREEVGAPYALSLAGESQQPPH